MTMIEISESKFGKMGEYVEKMLHYGGRLMSCLEELEGGEMGYRGGQGGGSSQGGSRYGMRSRYDNYGSREGGYGSRMGYKDEEDWEEMEEMGERRGRRRRDSMGRYR